MMTLCGADYALDWVRALPPDFKMVGPILPQPPAPLPAELQASGHALPA